MENEIKNRIEKSLIRYVRGLDKAYSIAKLSPLLFKTIEDFVLRKGKRLRPILFVIGYLSFTKKKPVANLYQAALSIELLHDFMLVHDDIIDKSDTRRGAPALHKMLDNHLQRFPNIKFNGQDLAIVAGDAIYALAIETFLSIKEAWSRKEKALKKFLEATIYTATGEFIELLNGAKEIDELTKKDIYKIYDYKTAYYTFAAPLVCGAVLAGAPQAQIEKLHKYGMYLGRAFQIRDDILGMFGDAREIGKSALTDLQEAKKTILVWTAYHNSSKRDKSIIKSIFKKVRLQTSDLWKMRKIITASGTLDYAQQEIANFIKKANRTINATRIHSKYKTLLKNYSQELLK